MSLIGFADESRAAVCFANCLRNTADYDMSAVNSDCWIVKEGKATTRIHRPSTRSRTAAQGLQRAQVIKLCSALSHVAALEWMECASNTCASTQVYWGLLLECNQVSKISFIALLTLPFVSILQLQEYGPGRSVPGHALQAARRAQGTAHTVLPEMHRLSA